MLGSDAVLSNRTVLSSTEAHVQASLVRTLECPSPSESKTSRQRPPLDSWFYHRGIFFRGSTVVKIRRPRNLQVFETNLRSKVRSGTEACGRGKLMALQQPQTGGFESWLPCDSAGWAAGPQLRTPQGRPTAQRHGVHVREGRLGHPGPKPPALCVMLFIGCQSSQPTRHKKQGSRGGEWSRGAG